MKRYIRSGKTILVLVFDGSIYAVDNYHLDCFDEKDISFLISCLNQDLMTEDEVIFEYGDDDYDYDYE